ncbi:MAG: hypothetical protein ACFFCI_03090 [Promethearchaeota archaeon]
MKKKFFLISVFLLIFFVGNLSFSIVIASDNDDDNIDDDFEELNKRNVNIKKLESDTAEIESTLRNGEDIDKIDFKFRNDGENGLSLEISYESDSSSGSEFDIEFEIIFHELVEYIDIDDNKIYDSSIDQTIQNMTLDTFLPIVYSYSSISSNTMLHYFQFTTSDNVFTAHIFIAEEFTIINNTLINPTESKIAIEINNFNYINNSSRLALYTILKSDEDFEPEEETEDEDNGYSSNEKGIITSNIDYTGFFSWQENATIDGVSRKVKRSEIKVDEHNESEQQMYINYPHGTKIYHDPKIGIEGLLRSKIAPFDSMLYIIIIILIGLVGATATAYIVYRSKKSRNNKNFYDDTDYGLAIHILRGDNAIEKLSKFNDLNITAMTEDFLERINKLEWDENEKEEFIKEMLTLAPEERNKILDEMIQKSNERNRKV